MNLETKAAELRTAIISCNLNFYMSKPHLSDLSARFWRALDELTLVAEESTDPHLLPKAVSDAHRALGAPGDFGYGTPCGDSLRAVYDLTNELCKAISEPR